MVKFVWMFFITEDSEEHLTFKKPVDLQETLRAAGFTFPEDQVNNTPAVTIAVLLVTPVYLVYILAESYSCFY